MSTASDTAFMKWFLFGCLGLSLTVRPCTPIAAIPVDASFLQNSTVSSTSGSTRILQVTGTLTAETTAERMAHALSGQDRRAAPIPPLSEKSFGQPMLMSMPATSRSLTATIKRLSERLGRTERVGSVYLHDSCRRGRAFRMAGADLQDDVRFFARARAKHYGRVALVDEVDALQRV